MNDFTRLAIFIMTVLVFTAVLVSRWLRGPAVSDEQGRWIILILLLSLALWTMILCLFMALRYVLTIIF